MNSKDPSKFCSIADSFRPEAADLVDVPFRQFREMVFFAHGHISRMGFGALASLVYAISHVVFLCAKKKMRWIHAGAIVATMANEQPIRDGAKMNIPRDAMRSLAFFIDHDLPISGAIYSARPDPAIAALAVTWRLVDTGEKLASKRTKFLISYGALIVLTAMKTVVQRQL